ncbi:MAG: glycosyltransferase family 39 protein, partial [Pseudomonadota bacterium]
MSVAARIILLHVLAWVVARSLSDPSLDPYGDMLETWHWGQSFSLGSDKHPPLAGWIAGLWFLVFPTNNFAFHLLAYVNAGVGLIGINALVHRLPGMLPGRDPVPVLICAAMVLPFSVLAVKFNANAILISVWPWLIYCFIRALSEPGLRFSVMTGILAALAMLGKYFSAVLLLTLFVVSFAT